MNEEGHSTSGSLARYLSGEASLEERLAVEAWATADPANAAEFEHMRSIWELGAGSAAPGVDVDRAWSQLQARIAEAEGRGRVIPLHRGRMLTRWVAAAAVLIGLFVGVRYWNDQRPQELMATTEHLRTVLKDKSTVVLSPGSRANVRMKDERRITLHGEGYFEVERDEARPFVVTTEAVTVTVLGTAFEVSAFDTSSSVLVRVRHGKVRVEAEGDTVFLEAGGYARFNKTAHLLERLPAPPATVFGDRIIQFQQAPMSAVVAQLEQLFQVRVQLAHEGLERCVLTATFEDEPIDYILRVIADTYGLTLTQGAPGTYLLDGPGC
ncbi:MAG: FecR domain-containing protein [Flavobacteriales bacterium]|nr:FecR domain-containing protein [Flavobacteriales bacterium]